MKKLSILVAIIVIVTIGGVYATWNYAGTSTEIGQQVNQTITLENAVQDGAAGSYTLSHNIASISIAPNNQEDKLATLVATYTDGSSAPKLRLTFTPAANAGDDIEANALASYVYFGTERDFTWKGGSMFTFANGKTSPMSIGAVNSGAATVWTKDGSTFTCELTFASLEELIEFSSNIYLPTIDDYNEFLAELGGSHSIQLHMHISNKQPA